jgi:hypothetical protein
MARWPIVAVFCVSLWLRAQYPAIGIWAVFDDQLFVRLAASLGMGDWLGPYDALTHAKGMFYSLFILVNHASGLPLKLTEHAVYLLVALFVARAVARLSGEGRLALPLFAVLAFSPYVWTQPAARIVREGLYMSLSLLVFGLWALWLAGPRRGMRLGIGVGAASAAYWLTREEGVWLLPALAVLALPWLAFEYRALAEGTRATRARALARAVAARLGPPLATCVALLAAVAALNQAYYGVFRLNDLRAGTPFARAYGALARVEHEHWRRYVVFPAEARRKVYAVSPAARELSPFFEGEDGRFWVTVSRAYPAPWGCAEASLACNDEILSAWFVWALREAVRRAGYYHDARATDHFYKRLAKEINLACDQGRLACHPKRDGVTPVWRAHYLQDTFEMSRRVLDTLVHFADHPLGGRQDPLTAEQRWLLEVASNSRFGAEAAPDAAPVGAVRRDTLRLALTQGLAWTYRIVVPVLAGVALLAYFALLAATRFGRGAPGDRWAVVLMTGLLVAVATRVALLGFLEATSIPSNNIQYLSAALPFFLLFITLAPGLAIAKAWRGGRRRLAGTAATAPHPPAIENRNESPR